MVRVKVADEFEILAAAFLTFETMHRRDTMASAREYCRRVRHEGERGPGNVAHHFEFRRDEHLEVALPWTFGALVKIKFHVGECTGNSSWDGGRW